MWSSETAEGESLPASCTTHSLSGPSRGLTHPLVKTKEAASSDTFNNQSSFIEKIEKMLPSFPGDPSRRWHSFAGENSLGRPQKSRGVTGEGTEWDMEEGGSGKDANW